MIGRNFKQSLIWTSCRLGNPGKNQHIDIGSAGAQQRPGAAVDGGSGCQHVIDQNQAPPGHRGFAVVRNTEGALKPTCCAVGLTRLSAPAATGTRVCRDIAAASMAD